MPSGHVSCVDVLLGPSKYRSPHCRSSANTRLASVSATCSPLPTWRASTPRVHDVAGAQRSQLAWQQPTPCRFERTVCHVEVLGRSAGAQAAMGNWIEADEPIPLIDRARHASAHPDRADVYIAVVD